MPAWRFQHPVLQNDDELSVTWTQPGGREAEGY